MLAIAREELCLGFALAGLECKACAGKDEAVKAIVGAADSGDVAILIVEEWLLEGIDPRMRAEFQRRAKPLLVAVPGELAWECAEGKAPDNLVTDLIRRAIGGRIAIRFDTEVRNG
ncbi:MAG: V-type ATP synthase subunit F [Spirochaetaceae bacterium]|nr:V-type ATP synthase subunit F [Spirochaetaceae bacterium]